MNLDAISLILGAEKIKTDSSSLKIYGKDWTKHFSPNASAVLFPQTTTDVAEIVKWARLEKVALIPSGGRTGLSAAAFATKGEVIVSLEKMNKILNFDDLDRTVTCQAGVITEDLQKFALEKGFCYPVDFAARGSSHIGGNVATNAGGIKVIKYGLTRNWVTSMTVVTGRGKVMKFNKSLVKNATGYDFRHLMIGSEGTLGFVTEVTIALARQPKDPQVFLFALKDLESVMNIFKAFRAKIDLIAFEMFTSVALKYIHLAGHVKSPLETDSDYYVVLEIEKDTEEKLQLAMEIFEDCMQKGWITDGTLAQNSQQAKDIWRLREDITESTSSHQPYKNDVSVRISKVPEFLQEMDAILKKDYSTFEVVWFGHIGDGNLHINILKPKDYSSEDFMEKCKAVDKKLFAMIEKHEGSISAEHGVGLVKKSYLKHTRSTEEVQLMREIKKVFDPDGILNPGKIFD